MHLLNQWSGSYFECCSLNESIFNSNTSLINYDLLSEKERYDSDITFLSSLQFSEDKVSIMEAVCKKLMKERSLALKSHIDENRILQTKKNKDTEEVHYYFIK